MSTFGYSTYKQIIFDVRDEIDDITITTKVTSESIQGYILQACQEISNRYPIRQRLDLRLVIEQSKYLFADTTTPVTGTGTVSASGKTITGVTTVGTGTISTDATTVTGVSTLFLTELSLGKMIIVGSEAKMVLSIDSATSCTIDSSFDNNLSASAFYISSTKFTKEVNSGSSVILNSITRTIDTITNGYSMTVTEAYPSTQINQTFTVDTKVTEIPTKFKSFEREADRLEGAVSVRINMVSNEELVLHRQKSFGVSGYSNLYQPFWASIWGDGSTKYLEIWPPVQSDKQTTLYGFVKINPRNYSSAALTDNIPLTAEHEPAIREYVKYKIYKRSKDENNAQEAFSLFNSYINSMVANFPSTKRVQVVTA